jgi:alkylhydroperoxidase family enzyme
MTVRLAPVSEQVAPKEPHIKGHIDTDNLTDREATAVDLASRMAADPHMVDDAFFQKLKTVFSEEEIVELVFGAAIYNFGNKFNITMRVDTGADSPYGTGLRYKRLGEK